MVCLRDRIRRRCQALHTQSGKDDKRFAPFPNGKYSIENPSVFADCISMVICMIRLSFRVWHLSLFAKPPAHLRRRRPVLRL